MKDQEMTFRLDYTGISLLIVGSFIPWIYYGFYCRPQPMIIYITMISILGIAAMIVSLWDKFAEPKFRWRKKICAKLIAKDSDQFEPEFL